MKGKRIIHAKRRIDREPEQDAISAIISETENEMAEENAVPVEEQAQLPVITIVGRPNVGKSSLFNCILKRRQAIVHFDSGVTRDRVSSVGKFANRDFRLFDTGGLGMYDGEKKGVDFWNKMIEVQVNEGIKAANTILFVVDVQAGLNPLDTAIAAKLRTCGKKILLVANKSDNNQIELLADEFHELGFDRVYPISCLHGRGIDSLMYDAVEDFPEITVREKQDRPLKIAVLGRPNVGKSSLINRLLGEERVIVSNVPGTTRDAIDTDFTLDNGKGEKLNAVLVDTAGLRKRSKVDTAVEQYSMMRAAEALENCDIVLFLIEASVGEATSQDKTIARMIENSGKGCILVVNKWDIRADEKQAEELLADIHYTLPKMQYAPVVFISAKTGYNFGALTNMIFTLRKQMNQVITTSLLNRVIQDAVTKNLPPIVGAKPLKIYYGTMTSMVPPKIMLFVNKMSLCADSYKVYLTNYFRKAFKFTGFPIFLHMQERERRDLSEVVNHAGSTGPKKRRVNHNLHQLKHRR